MIKSVEVKKEMAGKVMGLVLMKIV